MRLRQTGRIVPVLNRPRVIGALIRRVSERAGRLIRPHSAALADLLGDADGILPPA
jgi:hypothetical protein